MTIQKIKNYIVTHPVGIIVIFLASVIGFASSVLGIYSYYNNENEELNKIIALKNQTYTELVSELNKTIESNRLLSENNVNNHKVIQELLAKNIEVSNTLNDFKNNKYKNEECIKALEVLRNQSLTLESIYSKNEEILKKNLYIHQNKSTTDTQRSEIEVWPKTEDPKFID